MGGGTKKMEYLCRLHNNQSSPRGGGGAGIGWGFWHFLKKIIKIPTPGRKRIVKMSRNKCFTYLLLCKIGRSNAWCPIKIPTLGIYATVKFPWFARPPPPPGLDNDKCITVASQSSYSEWIVSSCCAWLLWKSSTHYSSLKFCFVLYIFRHIITNVSESRHRKRRKTDVEWPKDKKVNWQQI